MVIESRYPFVTDPFSVNCTPTNLDELPTHTVNFRGKFWGID